MVLLHPTTRVLLNVSIMALQLSLESYLVLLSATIIDTNSVQLVKESPFILVTDEGISMDVNDVQPLKAWLYIVVTPS